MKKRTVIIIIIIFSILLIMGIFIYINNKKENILINVTYKDNLNVEFLSEVKVSDFIENINGIILDDYNINTKSIGKKLITYTYINDDNKKVKQEFMINVIDSTSPIVWLGNNYSIPLYSKDTLLDNIMCGDNYDSNPKCVIEGNYDLNKVGVYPLIFRATDSSNNETIKEFNLNVYKPGVTNNNYNNTKTYFSDVYKTYKSIDTEIGVDISEWQGNVDFEALKNAGVEFVILRVGSSRGINGDYFLDGTFKSNIKKANDLGMPVGVYFYSYANSSEKAKADANWVLEQIKDYKIDLPIAFDWENWSFYNDFNLSFFGLTDMANTFLDVFKEHGYEGMIYSSKNYLEQIWLKTPYDTWLAHYTNNLARSSYKDKYSYWQLCSDGIVPGINGYVDINIRFK